MMDKETHIPEFSQFLSTTTDFDHQAFLTRYIPKIESDPYFINSRHVQEGETVLGSDLVSQKRLRASPLYPMFLEAGVEWSGVDDYGNSN